MKKILILMFFIPVFGNANPCVQDTTAKGSFILHKFLQPIGKETYSFVTWKDSVSVFSNFKFNDRGKDVPLKTRITLTPLYQPLKFRIVGLTSRSSVIDAAVNMTRESVIILNSGKESQVKPAVKGYTIGGYAPVVNQMLLLKWWKENGKPKTITAYPTGEISIVREGTDTVTLPRKQILERYSVKGLIWGREWVWTDAAGNLVALFTNDAEGDSFQAMASGYESILPILTGKAARYGVKSLKGKKLSAPRILALQNVDVLDVQGGKIVTGQTILIQNGIITILAAASKVKIPRGAVLIDGKGKTAVPGLWDMHAHFQQVEWGPAYLQAGVTTVRDCGNEFDFIDAAKEAIDKLEGAGPLIIKAGIVDGNGPMALGIVRASTPEEAVQVVRKYKDAGYVQIKLYSSIKPEIIPAIADEAHRLGLTVTGHIPNGVTLKGGVESGMDMVNHFTYVLRSMVTKRQITKIDMADSAVVATINLLKTHHTVIDPTLGIYEWLVRPLDQKLDAFEPGVNHVTGDLREIFRNTGAPPEEAAKRQWLLQAGKDIVLELHKNGIRFVAGTDMMVPGYSLLREIELYVEAGISPIDAIRSATIVPATVMKLNDTMGTVDQGKNADIVLIEGDPLKKIGNLRNIKTVIRGGVLYEPAEMRKMVDFTE